MGFFGKLFGSDDANQNTGSTTSSTGTVNLTAKAEAEQKIQLRAKTLTDLTDKVGLFATKARVALVLDISGSMEHLYRNHTVQDIVERILPLGIKFDDNNAIDVFLFSDGSRHIEVGEVVPSNFFGYVDNEIVKKHWNLMGGTDYSPVMERIIKKYTGTKGDPAYVVFITDGDNSDKSAAEATIRKASEYGIFWQFVGIGGASFPFLDKLDNLTGRKIDNANFFKANDIKSISDTELYTKMMAEFPQWLKDAKSAGII